MNSKTKSGVPCIHSCRSCYVYCIEKKPSVCSVDVISSRCPLSADQDINQTQSNLWTASSGAKPQGFRRNPGRTGKRPIRRLPPLASMTSQTDKAVTLSMGDKAVTLSPSGSPVTIAATHADLVPEIRLPKPRQLHFWNWRVARCAAVVILALACCNTTSAIEGSWFTQCFDWASRIPWAVFCAGFAAQLVDGSLGSAAPAARPPPPLTRCLVPSRPPMCVHMLPSP